MRVISVGVDIVDVDRIRMDIENSDSFVDRIITQKEKEASSVINDPIVHYCGVLAAKEAVIKTFDPSPSRGLLFHEIEVIGRPPKVVLNGYSANRAEELGIRDILVSISHERSYAIGMAIAVGDD